MTNDRQVSNYLDWGIFYSPPVETFLGSQVGAFTGRCVPSKTFPHFVTSGLLASEQWLIGKDKNLVRASKGRNLESL